MNATEVGKYFYNKNNKLSEIQVQKLTYYAYVWYMIFNSNKIFTEKPQAWVHGPVFRTLYDAMKEENFYDIENYNCDINIQEKSFLDMIYKLYGKYSGNQLERMTHMEAPWIKARGNKGPNERSTEEISDDDIRKYYGALLEN